MPAQYNLILDALPENERAALRPHLSRVEIKQHDILYNDRDEVDKVYFATDAVISLTVPLSTGEVIETAMVGRENGHGRGQ